jgi:thiosulfate/3-mercaptopyruvate sulfurtransferase
MDPLLAPARLAQLLADPDVARRPVVLDVRWRLGGPPARPDHDAAHIPGAVFLDMDTDLADPPGPAGRHPLPAVERLQSALRRAGVRDDSLVVAHDDAQGVQAARAWWLLRWAGFPAGRVAVLDGGYRGWVEAGLPTTDEPSRPEPGDVTVRPGGMPVLDADEAAALARSGVLLDARAPERYRGEHEPVDPKAGHIPGARNAPATDVLGADGRWLPPASLAEWLDGLAGGEEKIGAYCGSGATATALVLAAEHAGVRPPEHPIALYVGSWSNWSADPQRPVATGAAP